jgi:hypothetical protein
VPKENTSRFASFAFPKFFDIHPRRKIRVIVLEREVF